MEIRGAAVVAPSTPCPAALAGKVVQLDVPEGLVARRGLVERGDEEGFVEVMKILVV